MLLIAHQLVRLVDHHRLALHVVDDVDKVWAKTVILAYLELVLVDVVTGSLRGCDIAVAIDNQ